MFWLRLKVQSILQHEADLRISMHDHISGCAQSHRLCAHVPPMGPGQSTN